MPQLRIACLSHFHKVHDVSGIRVLAAGKLMRHDSHLAALNNTSYKQHVQVKD